MDKELDLYKGTEDEGTFILKAKKKADREAKERQEADQKAYETQMQLIQLRREAQVAMEAGRATQAQMELLNTDNNANSQVSDC